jgi:hypothetical protein
MDAYPSKSQACIPLLDLAMRMLEKALSLGLDAEGREAIQLRLRKCEDLKDQVRIELPSPNVLLTFVLV